MASACGTVTLGSHPGRKIEHDTVAQVTFGTAFLQGPSVVLMLAGMDMQAPKGRRVETWVSDVLCTGFKIHARTWSDSVVWSVEVTWVAADCDQGLIRMGTHSMGSWPDNCLSSLQMQEISFDSPLPCLPDVVSALSGFDADGERDLRIRTECNSLECGRFLLGCGSWEDSLIWSSKASWVASSSPASLQVGSAQIGSPPEDPICGNADRYIDVRFPRAFSAAPSVAVGIALINTAHRTPRGRIRMRTKSASQGSCSKQLSTRLETWVDKVTREGFRIHARTWEDSVTWFVQLSWVASPSAPASVSAPLKPTLPPVEYVVEKELGRGWWGVTNKARHIVDGQIYAVKTMKQSFKENEELLRVELMNLSRLPIHYNLLRYHSCILQVDRLHIVTEYVDGFELAQLVPKPDGTYPKRHSEDTILHWMEQLYDGLAHMHDVGMVHRDLHGENILVARDPLTGAPREDFGAIRIIDFGLAKVYEEMRKGELKSPGGFAQYFSPERHQGRSFSDLDDVWASGCHATELLTGRRIRCRKGCGQDGVDFAVTPTAVAAARSECGGERSFSRQLVEAVLIEERCRPPARLVRDKLRAAFSQEMCPTPKRLRSCLSPCVSPSSRWMN